MKASFFKIFLAILFIFQGFFNGNYISAQNVEDSLLNVVRTSVDDSIIVTTYLTLCDLRTYNDTKKAIEYADKALAIAQKTKFYLGVARSYERLGNAHFQLGENTLATENYLKAREANKQVGDYEIEGSILYNLGNIQFELGNYEKSTEYATEAGEVFLSHNDSIGYGATLYMISGNYGSTGNYDQAIKATLEALGIFQRQNVRAWEIFSLDKLVELYNVQKQYNKSLEILKTSLAYRRNNNNEKFTAITYRMLGDIYLELKDYEKARVALDSSFYLNDTRGFEQEKIKTMYSQGKLEFETENYNKALVIFEEGLQLSNKLNDELFKCSNYLGIGKCLYQKREYSGAIINLGKCVEHAKNIDDDSKLSEGYLVMSEAYEALNQPGRALDNYKLYAQFNDSVIANENKRQFAEMASKYEAEKKEQQISTLQLEKETMQSNKRRMAGLWILTSIIALLIVFILVLAYRKNRQLLANEKELDKIKSRFFANISHEFRTPLTLILGPVHDLLQKKETKSFHSELKMVNKQANRLLALINQILDLSKLDAGKYRLHITSGDFVAMLKSTVLSFHSLAETKNIRLGVKTDRNEFMANFDRENVETIINNLLSNAFKFEPEGGVIEVEMNVGDVEKTNRVQIKVTNRGSYIPPELCDNLFDRFYQSEHEQRAGKGTGIGLALTKELVELHGGKIEVKSSQEQGTRFFVTLPTNLSVTGPDKIAPQKVSTLQPVSEENEVGKIAATDSKTKIGAPVILIIEDHPEVSSYIQSVLQADYQIETAMNGREGIERALELVPDVIISDVMMPEKDGIEVTHTLKNNELTSHIPIILLTAKASVENRLEGLGAKADAYLTKPFNAGELQLRVKNMLDARDKLREKYSRELIIKPNNLVVKSLEEVFIEKICQTIEDNMGNEEFTVEELAGKIGLSRSQLHRKLEATTGKTASQFIREYRLERARGLIEKNVGTIAEISYQVGFNNPAYFNKCFKEYFKITPGELRNSLNLQLL